MRIATDEQVYASFQPHLDRYLTAHELDSLMLDARIIRNKYERAWDLANCIQWLDAQGELLPLAASWLTLEHAEEPGETGLQKIQRALDQFLRSPVSPRPVNWSLTLQVDSGNLIHEEFTDLEQLMAFIEHYSDPENILKTITPRKRNDPPT